MAGTKLSELAYFLYLALLVVPAFAAPPNFWDPPNPPTPGPGRKDRRNLSQTLYGQCNGRGYNGPSACPTTAYCSTQNYYYAQCAPYTYSTTTITSGNKPFTTTVTSQSSRVIVSVVTPVGTTTRTVTIPSSSRAYTSTVQATGFSSGTVIIGVPSSSSSSSSTSSSVKLTTSSPPPSSTLVSSSSKISSSTPSVAGAANPSSRSSTTSLTSSTSSAKVTSSVSSSTISKLTSSSSSSTSSTSTFNLYTATVCPSASTSAAPAPTTPVNGTCGTSSTAISRKQLLAGSPYHVLPNSGFCAQLCLNQATCQSFAVNTIAGSLTSDCYLYNSTTAAQNLATLNSPTTSSIPGNVSYYDVSCYNCASSSTGVASQVCNKNAITIDCLQALYGIPDSFTSVDSVSFGIMQLGSNVYSQSDLDGFAAKYGRGYVQPGYAPIFESISGGSRDPNQNNADYLESDIDFEYGLNMIYPQNVTLYQVGDPYQGGNFNTFLDAVDSSYCGGDDARWDPQYPDSNSAGYQGSNSCGTAQLTQVVSSSYAGNEALYTSNEDSSGETYFTPYYAQRQCMEYMKLGLMGTTVLFASGDNGAAGAEGWCVAYDPAVDYDNWYYYQEDQWGYFTPQFPASCPYVTSVGASMLDPNGGTAEVAAQWQGNYGEMVGSSGGFSNVFPIPSYQSSALAHYWANYAPSFPTGPSTNSFPSGTAVFNNSQTTRGFPDISANGMGWDIFWEGGGATSWGTSLSTPLFGVIFTMINQQRALVGKGPVGFVNPVVYANPQVFNDVTSGCTGGCGTQGFCAQPGWDPVTGLGTPSYPKLLKVFMDLP